MKRLKIQNKNSCSPVGFVTMKNVSLIKIFSTLLDVKAVKHGKLQK